MTLKAIKEGFKILWACVTFFLTVPVMSLPASRRRGPLEPWVIGGHRGRLRDDNSAALHKYLIEKTKQNIIWITSDRTLYAELKAQGIPVRKRNTFAGRWALLKAPVLIYSHGEDDLDLLMILLRGCLGYRVLINHSMHLMKTGEYMLPCVKSLRGLRRRIFEWLITDFDALLASSEQEKANFERAFPHQKEHIHLGSGAHLDELIEQKHLPRERTIFYFPTFRESRGLRQGLNRVIDEITNNTMLAEWLEEKDFRLQIGAHINTREYRPSSGNRIEWIEPRRMKRCLIECSLFVSDYSGTIFDCLLLDKPMVLFPFDLNDYLLLRGLWTPYESLTFSPQTNTVQDLVDLIISDRWRDQNAFAESRRKWITNLFPFSTPDYSRNCYETINRLAARDGDMCGEK